MSLYPLIQQAARSLRNTTAQSLPEIDLATRVCIPFLGLTFDCQGAFNYGTQKPKTTAALLNSTSTLTLTSTPAAAALSSITTAATFNQPRIADSTLKNASSKAPDSNSKQQYITPSESSITTTQATVHETAATTFISSSAHVTVAEAAKMTQPTSNSSIEAINPLSNNYIVTEASQTLPPNRLTTTDGNTKNHFKA